MCASLEKNVIAGIEAEAEYESYCEQHAGSPSALRRPILSRRGETWIALLGNDIKSGVVGLGATVAASLRAFDAQYVDSLRPPAEARPSER